MAEPLCIDVFWSFRSPWSYLATPRLAEWRRRYQLEVRFRPVLPIAVRTPEFFEQVHPMWFGYFMTDVFRVAECQRAPSGVSRSSGRTGSTCCCGVWSNMG